MTRTEILLHIEELVKKLDEQQHRLQAFGGEIPALESDLLQRQVRQLYEFALALEKVRTEETVIAPPQPVAMPQPVAEKPVEQVKMPEPAEMQEPSPVVAVTPPTPSVHESPTEHILVEAAKKQEQIADALPTAGIKAKKIKGDVNSVLFKDQPTLGDRFEDEPTIHERIAAVNTAFSSIASHQQRKPIQDLKRAIGLNEKFLFINHLFDGNLQVYNQAIDFLDSASGKNAAMEYIQQTLLPQFSWDINSQPCHLFLEVVERRFVGRE
jgi:hypothetical protein